MAVETGANEVPCPDPSAHEHTNKLSAQASTAALYVTNHHGAPSTKTAPQENVLGPDGKLSSKGAAASLKYAKPQDLPSFPSAGGSMSNAGAAATLAKDYKMKDLWHPETSSAGSAAAAIAHRDGGKLDLWQPSASAAGNSAAVLAMRNKGLSPQLDRGYTKTGQSNALLAATMSQKNTRQRAESIPSPAPALYPDQANSAYNALNAATVSHRGSVRSPPPARPAAGGEGYSSAAMQAARVHNIGANVNPEMWGERPPVEIEEEERKHKAALRASAVSMAKQMYDYQNRTVLGPEPSGNAGAEAAMARGSTPTAPVDLKTEALRYIHLQEAAQKLAQERLAKVDKNFESAKYREYYGYGDKPARSRLSMRGRNRRRSTSEGQQDDDSSDEEGARRVRSQMNQFNSAVADVDAKKQSTDRKALLAAAERNVNKRMSTMDDRVFQETGKVSQAKMDEWAAKAREKAERDSALRTENHGKMHIGGGKFMDQAEIERIAQARLQPTLDEINDTAERKRAHDEELRLEREEQERQKKDEKQKHREEKDEQKKIKNEEKAVARKEKEERKAAESERKTNEKAEQRKSMGAEDEQKSGQRKSFLSRLASKRKSREVKKDDAETPAVGAAAGTAAVATTTESSESKPSTSEAERTASDPVETKVETAEPIVAKEDAAPPALERTHTGNSTDAVPAAATSSKKPDLERHISKIHDSSSDSDWSESDAEEEAGKHKAVPVAAAGASGAAVATVTPDHDAAHAKAVAERVVGAPTTTITTSPSAKANPTPQDTAPISKSADTTTPTATTSTTTKLTKTDPTATATTTTSPRASTTFSRPSEEKETTQPKGFRGFFSKLRSSKPPNERTTSTTVENRAPTISGTPDIASTTADATATSRNGSVISQAGSKGIGSGDRSVSPSSFTRHGRKSDEADVSSLSSSGLEEDDIVAHGSGRAARAEKPGKARVVDVAGKGDVAGAGAGKKGDIGSGGEDGDSDQFEEARDHFDEGLAPKPAFGGQAKSQSPGRGTRFHEEV